MYITEKTSLKDLRKLVAEAKEIDDEQHLNAFKLYYAGADANDDSFNEMFLDEDLVLQNILRTETDRELDLKMFTTSEMTKISSAKDTAQIIFHKNKHQFQIHLVDEEGGQYHLKSYKPESINESSPWVSSMFLKIYQYYLTESRYSPK